MKIDYSRKPKSNKKFPRNCRKLSGINPRKQSIHPWIKNLSRLDPAQGLKIEPLTLDSQGKTLWAKASPKMILGATYPHSGVTLLNPKWM